MRIIKIKGRKINKKGENEYMKKVINNKIINPTQYESFTRRKQNNRNKLSKNDNMKE